MRREYSKPTAPSEPHPVQVDIPHRQPSLEADVLVPLAQTILTALTVGSALAVLTVLIWHTPAGMTWLVWVSVCAAAAWLWRLDVIHTTLWRIETFVDADLDHDGAKGNPGMVMINPYQGQAAQRAEAEEWLRQRFADFVRGCAMDTSARLWEKKLGRERYAQFRGILIAQGYAAWNSEQDQRSGWRLTAQPDVILAGIFGQSIPTETPALADKRR